MNQANKEFAEYFRKWEKDNKCIQQVSHSRSGGHWLQWIIERVSGRQCYTMVINYDNENNIIPHPNDAYFNNHWTTFDLLGDKYVFLVRDPRSIMWSKVDWARGHGNELINDLCFWSHFVNVYRGYFNRYLTRNTIVVQYERICLYPVEEITRVMKFIEYDIKEDIQEVVAYFDTDHRDNHPDLPFKDGYDRYLACCLKWQNDEYRVGHRDFLWKNLGDIMIHYGYTKDGHARKLFNL